MIGEDVGVAYNAFVERVAAAVADDGARNRIAAAYGQYPGPTTVLEYHCSSRARGSL